MAPDAWTTPARVPRCRCRRRRRSTTTVDPAAASVPAASPPPLTTPRPLLATRISTAAGTSARLSTRSRGRPTTSSSLHSRGRRGRRALRPLDGHATGDGNKLESIQFRVPSLASMLHAQFLHWIYVALTTNFAPTKVRHWFLCSSNLPFIFFHLLILFFFTVAWSKRGLTLLLVVHGSARNNPWGL
jgi:hypothetical protein